MAGPPVVAAEVEIGLVIPAGVLIVIFVVVLYLWMGRSGRNGS